MLRATLLITALSIATGGAAYAQSSLDTLARPAASADAPTVVDQTVPAPASGVAISANPDPYEKLNRRSYKIFVFIDSKAVRPAAVFYAHAVPHVVRKGLHNVIQNVGEPVIFFNDVVQLHPKAAAQSLGRLAVNSTIGIAGLTDPATGYGIPYHENGFGTTLGRYGVPTGPFLFIPVLGPSDVRDLVGSGVDTLSSPFTWIQYTGSTAVNISRTVVAGVDTRSNADAQLKQVTSLATDPYASLRSLYLQNRQAQITGGKVNVNDLPDFGPEPSGTNQAGPNQAGTAGAPEAAIGPAGAAAALPSRAAPTTAQPSQPVPPPQP